MIRKLTARTRKIMISHFPIVHYILPVKPRMVKITAMTINSIPGYNGQSDMMHHYMMSGS